MPFRYELLPTADFHVHLRDGKMMETVVPTISRGGVDTVYVMPNLTPPITTVAAALAYKARLEAIAPNITFLLTLYLHPDITPTTIAEASAAGIAGVKVYPAGVTTNSAAGVLDLAAYDSVFAAMQEHNLVLNLHGECVSTSGSELTLANPTTPAITVLNAEQAFLPTLKKLHTQFPKLRIVLEHCTTREALQAVEECGETVAATITAHHLWMTVDDWCGDVYGFCKPVAKRLEDRIALCQAVVKGHASHRIFFGSDSAPHPISAKKGQGKTAAGCFTQPWASQLVIGAMDEAVSHGWLKESDVTQKIMNNFLSRRGKSFYGIDKTYRMNASKPGKRIVVEKGDEVIPSSIKSEDGTVEVVPFRSGQSVWSLKGSDYDLPPGLH